MKEYCHQCPRACYADRANGKIGYCGVPETFIVARVAKHLWEEPPISGKNGSGTIFFSGCNLRCVFCQNREISHTLCGKAVDSDRLLALMQKLQEEGAENINLVTPTQYAEQLIPVLIKAKSSFLHIPLVYNCGGYESVETLRKLDGLIDIYLPDFKYSDSGLSMKYSAARDYCRVATDALEEMLRQTGAIEYDERGMLKRGVIVRHLVLPGNRKDSVRVLQHLYERFGKDAFLLSLMNQYTPAFAKDCPYPELKRKLTSFEYDSVAKEAERLGFLGFVQSSTSATEAYTPDFYEETF